MADDEAQQFKGGASAESSLENNAANSAANSAETSTDTAFDAAQQTATEQQVELAEDTLDDEADQVEAEHIAAAEGEVPAASELDEAETGDAAAAAALRKVQGVLNATVDTRSMTPQMKRMMQRQEDNTRRVEEAIKGTKANPSWFVPTFCALMIIGLVWAVVYYFNPGYPIPGINAWNLLIGFSLIFAGFIMMMWWR